VHSGAWTRPTDFATGAGASGAYFFVTGGTANGSTSWACSNASGSDTIDTSALTFVLFSNAVQGPRGATGATGPAGSANAAGTTNTIAKFTGTNSLGNSSIYESGGRVGVGTTAPGNQLSVVGAFTTGNDTIPALGANGGKFALLNDGGAGDYGLLFGVQGTGVAFIQAQRTDGTATAYNLLMQPNGGYIGVGVLDPTCGVDTPTLRVRTGAAVGGSAVCLDNGTLQWTTETPGFGAWTGSVAVGSGTSYLIGTFALTDTSRASQVWSVEIEAEVVLRKSDDATVTGRCVNKLLFCVTYNSSGVVTQLKTIGDNGTAVIAQNNEQGLPPITDAYLTQYSSIYVGVYVAKASGGNAAEAKARIRKLSEIRLDNW
jgi:hypothetical protein